MEKSHIAFLALCFVLIVLTLCVKAAVTTDIDKRVTAEEAYALINEAPSPVLIDVRTTKEYRTDRLKDAIHIPVQKFATGSYKKSMTGIPKDAPIVVYCWHGVRSVFAQKVLAKAGYSLVKDLKGGTAAWKEAGFPMDESKPEK